MCEKIGLGDAIWRKGDRLQVGRKRNAMRDCINVYMFFRGEMCYLGRDKMTLEAVRGRRGLNQF